MYSSERDKDRIENFSRLVSFKLSGNEIEFGILSSVEYYKSHNSIAK